MSTDPHGLVMTHEAIHRPVHTSGSWTLDPGPWTPYTLRLGISFRAPLPRLKGSLIRDTLPRSATTLLIGLIQDILPRSATTSVEALHWAEASATPLLLG